MIRGEKHEPTMLDIVQDTQDIYTMPYTPLLLEQFTMYQAKREDVTDYKHTVFSGYTESGLLVHIGAKAGTTDVTDRTNDYRVILGRADTGDITPLALKEIMFTPRRNHGERGHVIGCDLEIEAYTDATGELYQFYLSHDRCQVTGPDTQDVPQSMLDLQSLGYELYRQAHAMPQRAEQLLAHRALDLAS